MRGNRRPKIVSANISSTEGGNRSGSRTPTATQTTPTQEAPTSSPTSRSRNRRGSRDTVNVDNGSSAQITEQESNVDDNMMNIDTNEASTVPLETSQPMGTQDTDAENLGQSHFLPQEAGIHVNMNFSESNSYGQGGFDNNTSYMFPPPTSLSGAGWPSMADNMNTAPYANSFATSLDTSSQQMDQDVQQNNSVNSITGPALGPNGRPLPSPFTSQPLMRSRHGDGRPSNESSSPTRETH